MLLQALQCLLRRFRPIPALLVTLALTLGAAACTPGENGGNGDGGGNGNGAGNGNGSGNGNGNGNGNGSGTPISVTATVTGLTATSFTLSLAPGVPGLTAADLTLTPDVSITDVQETSASGSTGASYTVETAALTSSLPYILGITKSGYAIANTNFTTPVFVTASVTGLTTTSFTLTLAPGVPGLTGTDLTLTQSTTIANVNADDTSNNTRYTVTTQPALTSGQEYALAITKADYSITGVTFTFVTASVTGLTARGFTLQLTPGVSGLTAADLTLTPDVSITDVQETAASGSTGASYTVETAALTSSLEYILGITKSGYAIANANFTTPIFVTASVTGLTARGFTLQLTPGVSGLTAADLTLTPDVSITDVQETAASGSTGASYTVETAALTSSLEYILGITKSGYAIANANFTTPIFVTASVTGLTARGFTLQLTPGVSGLTAADLTLTPDVSITDVQETAASGSTGASYTVETEALTPGRAYRLAITKTGYDITSPSFTLILSVTASVTGLTTTSFTLTLTPGVPGLTGTDLTLTQSTTIANVNADDTSNNTRYTVETQPALTSGQEYALAITKAGYNITGVTFTSVTASVTGFTATGFTLTLTPGVPGLTGTDLTLTPDVSITEVMEVGTSGTRYTAETAALTSSLPYILGITKSGYAIANTNFTTPVFVTASVTGLTATSFTLSLAPGVPGLVSGDLTLTPDVSITAVQETGTPNTGARYTVTTEALTLSQPYVLTISKTDYSITGVTFTFTGEASITGMKLTVHGVEVEGAIDDSASTKTIRFPSGAYSNTGPTLTGIVSLTFSTGAQADGTNPHNTSQAYGSTAKTITVQTADDATKQTYSVTVAAYNASQNPYGVYTAAQLQAVAVGSAVGASYRLMQSLTLPGTGCGSATPTGFPNDYCTKGFQPIGTESTSFTGTFDGNKHTLYNLAILRDSASHVGLFGAIGASGAVRNLGVNMAAAGVKGSGTVGGLAGKVAGGTVSNCYAAGAVTGSGAKVGGVVGHMARGSITNAYAVGAVYGGGGSVGGLVGEMEAGAVAKSYATGAVFGLGSTVGGLIGNKTSGAVTNGYYPAKRPAGTGTTGEALNSEAGQSAFANFVFNGANADWEWAAGAWPQLKGFEGTQKTPSLTFHEATVSTTTPAPSTAGFTITLASALSGRTRGAWALYEGSAGASIPLLRVAQGSGGAYTFAASLVAGKSYQLVYTKPDVIVVPASGTTIAVTVPSNTDILSMTLDVDGVVLPGKITAASGSTNGTTVFPFAQWGSTTSAADPKLTGTVSLQLAPDRTVSSSLDGQEKTYTTTATTISVTPSSGAAKSYDVTVAAYNATSNPYGVYTPAQLHGVRNGLTASHLLMQDVTLPNAAAGCTQPDGFQADYCTNGWQPIGAYSPASAQFKGKFDGNGHTISNLFIQRSGTDFVGLFGYVGTSGEIRNLGVNMAATGVRGSRNVGGLVGQIATGTIANCYATGAVTGNGTVGGLVGSLINGTTTNCYATGAVSGANTVGGLVGYLGSGTVTNSYATGAVSGSDQAGGLMGWLRGGTVTASYYPQGRPAGRGTGGAFVPTGATQANFSDFAFTGANAAWEWVDGKWPQLTGMEAVQATPGLAYYTATVAPTPDTSGFAIALAPPLSGRAAAHNWALYEVTSGSRTTFASSTAITLPSTGATVTNGGARYAFTVTLTAMKRYQLIYTQPDVIVVPASAGHITFTLR